jgi:predicted transcriptional regulator
MDEKELVRICELPCTLALWIALQALRAGLTSGMVKEFKVTQEECAGKLGVAPATVSQNLSRKRSSIHRFSNTLEKIRERIRGRTRERIRERTRGMVIKNAGKNTGSGFEICMLCKFARYEIA